MEVLRIKDVILLKSSPKKFGYRRLFTEIAFGQVMRSFYLKLIILMLIFDRN